jgi:hypothetical protein
MDKSLPASPQHFAAALRWVEMTVAHAMVFRNDPLEKDRRRAIATEIVGRWRGNRGAEWTPTVGDVDRLYESTVKWAVEQTGVRLFD